MTQHVEKKEGNEFGLKTKIRMDFLLATLPMVAGIIIMIVQQREMMDRMNSTWTTANMAVWCKDLQYNNPSLKVPDPGDVKRIMGAYGPSYLNPLTASSNP